MTIVSAAPPVRPSVILNAGGNYVEHSEGIAAQQRRAGTAPDPASQAHSAEFSAKAEVSDAERDARRPEGEARSARSQAEGQTADARDPVATADREGSREASHRRSEHVGEQESAVERAKGTADQPDREAKTRARKLDDE